MRTTSVNIKLSVRAVGSGRADIWRFASSILALISLIFSVLGGKTTGATFMVCGRVAGLSTGIGFCIGVAVGFGTTVGVGAGKALVTTTFCGVGVETGAKVGCGVGVTLTMRWREGVGTGVVVCEKTVIDEKRATKNPTKTFFFIILNLIFSR